jgi:hypothetical protein
MCQGRAEEPHDAVAITWVTVPSYRCARLHHVFEDRIENPARLLGITIGWQLIEFVRSVRSTVTRLRSPSRAPNQAAP